MCQKVDIANFTASAEDYKIFQQMRTGLKTSALDFFGGEFQAHQLHAPTVDKSFKELWKSYSAASGKSFSKLTPGSPEWKKLADMELNLFSFAALKNYNFLKASEEFRTGTVNEFTKSFDDLFRIHYERMFAVEREHVKRVGEAQTEWEDYTSFAEEFQYITYHTAGDERVRPQHRAWDKITLPVGHPFWKTHFPPNGYNCRCSAVQDFEIEEGDRTEPTIEDLPKPDPGFRTNFGDSDKSFGQTHSYYQVDFKQNPELNKRISELFKSHLKGFVDHSDKVRYHPSVPNPELDSNIKLAEEFAEHSNTNVILNPMLNTDTNFKNPDFVQWGVPGEFKTPKSDGWSAFLSGVDKAADQLGEIAVLKVEVLNERYINRINGMKLNGVKRKASRVKQLWILDNQGWHYYKRDAEGKFVKK